MDPTARPAAPMAGRTLSDRARGTLLGPAVGDAPRPPAENPHTALVGHRVPDRRTAPRRCRLTTSLPTSTAPASAPWPVAPTERP